MEKVDHENYAAVITRPRFFDRAFRRTGDLASLNLFPVHDHLRRFHDHLAVHDHLRVPIAQGGRIVVG